MNPLNLLRWLLINHYHACVKNLIDTINTIPTFANKSASKFSGELSNWELFRDQFKALIIDNNNNDNKRRLICEHIHLLIMLSQLTFESAAALVALWVALCKVNFVRALCKVNFDVKVLTLIALLTYGMIFYLIVFLIVQKNLIKLFTRLENYIFGIHQNILHLINSNSF